jgi:ubiquinone biosynthesis protein Coq4
MAVEPLGETLISDSPAAVSIHVDHLDNLPAPAHALS